MPPVLWHAPDDHKGRTIAIIGGGPSLKSFDLESLRSFPTIAVNNAWQIAPWANYCFFGDKRWWQWNSEKVISGYENEIVTSNSNYVIVNHPRLKRMRAFSKDAPSLDRTRLFGPDSGTQAINLAFHFGAANILLAGFDMRPAEDGETHWHREHKIPTVVKNYNKRFGPRQTKLIEALRMLGVETFRVTEPGLPCAPYRPIGAFLA